MKRSFHFKQIAVILFWLVLWQLASLAVRNSVLLVGPLETARALWSSVRSGDFWLTVVSSVSRIWLGLLLGALSGILTAALSFAYPILHTLLSPFVSAMKSVPVACFTVMLLIWAGAKNTPLIVTALVVFPVLYLNLYQGLTETDPELVDIAALFPMTRTDRIRHLYLPAAFPFLKSGLQIACGMSWKSGVAAEVITQRARTLGGTLYDAKVLLETDRVFAVTVTVILLSFCTEKLVLYAVRVFGQSLYGRED